MKNNRELVWYLVGAVFGMVALAIALETRRKR